MQTNERARMILQTLQQMEKQFGKGAVLQLGSRNALPVNVIPTGTLSLGCFCQQVIILGKQHSS
jgi:recombination protein RecA